MSPDATTVLASTGRAVWVWDARTEEPLAGRLEHLDVVTALALSPDGQRCLTACGDGAARLWDVASRKLVCILRHHGGVRSVAFSPDGKTAATGSTDGKARLWDTSTGKLLGSPLTHPAEVMAVAFSPTGGKY